MTKKNLQGAAASPGTSALIPCLIVDGGAEAMRFYQRAFGAEERLLLKLPDGRIHGEIDVAGARVQISDEYPEMGYTGPKKRGGSTVNLALYVVEVEAAVERAVAAGASLERPIADEFYGDRVGHIVDPYGHRWSFHARIEDVTPEEMQRRADRLFAGS
jgi:PhnB protein